jgi:hypothetical protein
MPNKGMRVMHLLYLPLLVASLLYVPFIRAQAVANASVTGRVVDSSGASIGNAKVTITGTDTGIVRTTQSNEDGLYTVPSLPVGPYMLQVTSSGFQNYTQTGIVLRVGDNVAINVSMTVGAATETVSVAADAAMVQTQQNNVSQVIDQRRIIEMPLNGRNPMQLITISGGSVNHSDGTNTGAKSFLPAAQSIAVAGAAGNQTNYLLDGGDNNDAFTNVNLPFPFPDALQEFSVGTNSLPARNGLHPGGLVNAVTKSGSNQWHGSAFEFVRNYGMNAISYFSPKQDMLKRNQFGGTFGGRVIRDKLFFFGGYQGSLIRQDPSTSTLYIPTQAMLKGDFTAVDGPGNTCQAGGATRAIKDPTTGLVLSSYTIDPTHYDPAAVKLASYFPATSDPCGKLVTGVPVSSNEAQYIARVDSTLNSKQSIFGRYLYDDYNLKAFWDPKNILVTNTPGNAQRVQSFVLGDIYMFSPTVVNSFHLNFSRRRINRGPNAQSFNASTLGVKNVYQGTPQYVQVTVGNGGFTVGNSGGGSLAIFNVNSLQAADDVDWMKGKHQVAFGVDFIRLQSNQNSHYEDNGWFQFSNIYSGDSLLDYLTGYMNKYEQTMPQQAALRQSVPSLYVQDTYHLTPKMVVNAGVRWEPLFFPQDFFGRGSTFSQSNFNSGVVSQVYTNAPAGLLFYGDKDVPKAFTRNTIWHFSPRFGVVYNPDGKGKTTIRAGGAYLFDTLGIFLTYRLSGNNLPYGITDSLTSGPYQFSDPWAKVQGGNPFPLPFNPPKNFTFPLSASNIYLPSQFKPTSMAQWSLGVQHQLSPDWVLTASYLGNSSSHLMIGNEMNPAVYIPGNWSGPGSCGALTISPGMGNPCSSTGNTQNRRKLNLANPTVGKYYGTLVLGQTGMSANYNGLLVSIEHRFSKNYSLLANYTWSKCMSVQPVISLGVEGMIQNPSDPRSDYGPCTYDAPTIINITGVVASDFKVNNRLMRDAVNGWQFAPLMRYQSGLPFNPTTGVDNSLTGISQDRPNVVAGQNPYANAAHTKALFQYINPAAYVKNPLGTFGNTGHMSLRGPNYVNFDAAISRMFAIRDRLMINMRFEAFNLANHPNFNNPSTSVSSTTTFGRITSVQDPRILQAAAKLTF